MRHDNVVKVVYLAFQVGNGTVELRYDDPLSLLYKIVYAKMAGIAGVGMWTANFLDYSDSSDAEQARGLMWRVMP